MIIDQTASERELHRTLYIIKMLRAMIIHLALAATGLILYVTTDFKNVYPVATALIQSLLAASAQYNDAPSGTMLGFFLAIALIFAGVVAMIVWIYRSLTSVNRRALRIQAALLVLMGATGLNSGMTDVRFAVSELHPLLAFFGTAALLITNAAVPIVLAFVLVRVSRIEERSSLLATLDPRLAPTRLVHIAKLLDLPRTPLRTFGSFAAFTLACAGALVMTASLLYLITVGGASNKSAALQLLSGYYTMPEVVRASEIEGWRIALMLPVALAGVKFAALLQSSAKRLGGLSVSDVVTRNSDRFLLYLRPFDLDAVILPRPRLSVGNRLFAFRPYPVRIEEELFDVADGYLPLIAIGKPGTAGAARGGLAYRTFLADTDWQAFAADHIRRAECIVLVVEATPGVRWEIDRILLEHATPRTLFFFRPRPAGAPEDESRSMMVDTLRRSGIVPPDFAFASTPLGFYLDGAGDIVEIVNAHWSATSYRTAFSHFLAETSASPERRQRRPAAGAGA